MDYYHINIFYSQENGDIGYQKEDSFAWLKPWIAEVTLRQLSGHLTVAMPKSGQRLRLFSPTVLGN